MTARSDEQAPHERPSFDPDEVALGGTAFIEASAGTGKTHALTSLYVRLIAERGLCPRDILVVTFTNAATAELRDRIRRRLRDTLSAIEVAGAGAPGSPRSAHAAERAARLRRALRDFDEAAIFTIHGFCQRTLQESAFESGLAFEAELVEKPERLQRTLVHDLRSALLAGEPEAFREWLAAGAGKRWAFEPDALYALVAHGLGPDETMPILPPIPPVGTNGPDGLDAGNLSALCEAADLAWRAFAAAFRSRWSTVEALLCADATKLNRRSYKPDSIRTKWRSELEEACAAAEEAATPGLRAGLEPPECVAKYLTPEKLAATMNGGLAPPVDPFFEVAGALAAACAALSVAFDARAVDLRCRFVRAVREASAKRRDEQHVLFFDDLLAQLRVALRAPGGERLVAGLRERYCFALIDEFQDTDPVQYEIFRTVWHADAVARAGGGLFLIGDPKQAIYAFRGADVQTYLAARRDAGRAVHTLGVNHRSDPEMVAAVNTLFDGPSRPFAHDAIAFQPVKSATREDREPYRAEPRFAAGLRVSLLQPEEVTAAGESAGRLTLRFARTRGMKAMACDVAALLESGATIGGRPIAPSDVAILARRKNELEAARRALEALGIPCVSRGEGNVFDAREAWELASVLAAWLRPGDPRRLRAALSTGAQGFDSDDLLALGDDDEALVSASERQAEYGRIWSRHGFARAFATWRAREEVDARLLAWSDGDRRLTNWLHLAELLARIESERGASRTSLAAWLDRAIVDELVREELGGDASLLRLERDDQAVQLVTLHASKGLEYEVVYLPCLWESFEAKASGLGDADETKRRPPVRFHDANSGLRTLDLGGDFRTYAEHRRLARAEAEAEHLRLLYVGLTRARRHCVVLWGRIDSAYAKSPLVRLVLGPDATGADDSVEGLAAYAKALDDAGWERAWRSLAGRAPAGAIRIEPATLDDRPGWRARATAPSLRPFEPVSPLALRPLATTSFSGLVRGAARGHAANAGPLATGRDLDAEVDGPRSFVEGEAIAVDGDADAEGDAADLAADMQLFPRGAEAGTLLHEVLERVDLSADDDATVRPLALEWLARSPLSADVVDQVVHVVRSVARTPLRSAPALLCLGDLPPGRLLPELEFTLDAPGDARGGGFSPEALAGILADARPGSPLERYAERAAALSWPVLNGYLRGFIDAVFRDGERWYVVDYKSNHLGVRQRDYLPERLVAPMIEHDYVLQYLLYVVAVDRHLGRRLADYDYERHFGGAYYLFLRGLAPAHTPGCGVFFDRPEAEIVRRVSALIGVSR